MKSRPENKHLFGSQTVGAKEQQSRHAQFESAFYEHYQSIFNTLVRITGETEEAEDLAIETFWQLWTKPPAHADNLRGWLFRVALRLSYNRFRSNRRRVSHEQRAEQQRSDEHSPLGLEAQAEAHIEQERVRQVLRQMPDRQAQILILRYAGLSYKEIAAALEVKPGSVGALLARAEETFEKRYRSGGGDASI